MEIGSLPGSLTLSVLMSSVLTTYVSVHLCIAVQVLVEAHTVEQCFAPGKYMYNCFVNPLLLMFTSPNSI